MKRLYDFCGQELEWKRPHWTKNEYELCIGDEVLARLRWEKLISPHAIAEVSGTEWLFKREGFWQTKAAIYHTEGNMVEATIPVATIQRGMSGKGTLIFPDGREYRWVNTRFWRGEWTWFTNENVPLIHLERKRLVIEPMASSLPELPLLVTFGYYLLKLTERDTASAAAGTVIITS
jgi:hypothetical protein